MMVLIYRPRQTRGCRKVLSGRSPTSRMNRRAILGAIAVTGGALAGCAAIDPPNPADGNVADAHIETVATNCGSPEDDHVVVVGEDPIELVGTTPAPTPCYRAVIEQFSLSNGTLTTTVGVEDDLPEGEACIQCHGAISYEIAVDIARQDLESVVVTHTEGERHEPQLF